VDKKPIGYYKKKAVRLLSEYVRRKYADKLGTARCYTCGNANHWKSLQCGHAIPGRHNAVLLDEEICRPQCHICNILRHGNLHLFVTKLSIENGEAWWLTKLADSNRPVKVRRADYEAIIEDLEKKIEQLNEVEDEEL